MGVPKYLLPKTPSDSKTISANTQTVPHEIKGDLAESSNKIFGGTNSLQRCSLAFRTYSAAVQTSKLPANKAPIKPKNERPIRAPSVADWPPKPFSAKNAQLMAAGTKKDPAEVHKIARGLKFGSDDPLVRMDLGGICYDAPRGVGSP